MAMPSRPRPTEQSQLVPLRARVRPELVRALHEEALARRLTPGRLLAELLAETLPSMAAERVRRQVAPARSLRVELSTELRVVAGIHEKQRPNCPAISSNVMRRAADALDAAVAENERLRETLE